MEPPIANCLVAENFGTSIYCHECANGIPTPFLKGCLPWSGASEAEQPSLENCLSGRKEANHLPVRCAVCKDGFAYDTTSEKCVRTTTAGCWKVSNGVCISCRAWDGYFSDGFDIFTTGQPVLCKKLEEHYFEINVVSRDLENINAEVMNMSRTNTIPPEVLTDRQRDLRQYADFKGGFLARALGSDYFITNSTESSGFTELSDSNFGLKVENILYPTFYYQFARLSMYQLSELMKCFYYQKMCLIVNNVDEKNSETESYELIRQEVFIFNATNPRMNGVIFRNKEINKGKYISNILPIAKSSYVILAFPPRVEKGWTSESEAPTPRILLRLDYLDTKMQFEYTIQDTKPEVRCFKLLYIEYSKYFVASFSKNNGGVLIYDITKSTKTPYITIKPKEQEALEHIAYLEARKVLLMVHDNDDRLMGYSMTRTELYQIETRPKIKSLFAIKSSDFFVIMEHDLSNHIYIYNLQGMVHHIELERSIFKERLVYSEYFQNLFALQHNTVLKYSWKPETNNPSCRPDAEAQRKYSFGNKWCSDKCADGAVFSQARGSCQFSNDSEFLVYFDKDLPKDCRLM